MWFYVKKVKNHNKYCDLTENSEMVFLIYFSIKNCKLLFLDILQIFRQNYLTIWREFYFKIDEFTDFTSKSCKLTINIVIWGKIRDFQFWANFSMKWINLAIKRKIRNFYLKYFFDDFPSNGQSKLVKIDFTSKSWKS